jgi:multiple antibiotic resistance protein
LKTLKFVPSNFIFMELFISVLASLFSVVNPFGVVPMYLAMTPHYTVKERAKLSMMTSFYFLLILISFFIAGTYILAFFGLDINALRIAGGLVILNSSFKLLNDKSDQNQGMKEDMARVSVAKTDISFSPLAMPMLSGPGSISLLIGMGADNKNWENKLIIFSVILINALIVYGVLRLAPLLFRVLGVSGLKAGSRIMGFLTMAIGVQYIIFGLVNLVEQFAK